MKTCRECGIEKPLSDFYQYKNGTHPPSCKKCAYIAQKSRVEANKDAVAKYQAEYRLKNLEALKEYRREYGKENKELLKAKKNAEREKWLQYNKKYHAANRERILDRMRGYKKENPHLAREYRKANKDRLAESRRAWAKSNLHKLSAKSARRRAALLRAIPCWVNMDEILAIYEEARAQSGMHVDHIVPLQSKYVCGLHVESNLQIIPGSENQSKGNRYWPDMP